MKKGSLFKKFTDWEIHHKVIFFIAIMILTILITRGSVLIRNPTNSLFGFELHHFDFGLILLLITTLLLLFSNKNLKLHLILAGIAFGWIIDDIWFIRSNLNDPETALETIIYNSSFLPTILILVAVILLIFLIRSLRKSHSKSA
jgi:hypothetical protein